ncbi:MAG: sigma-70 family RNA polymerase sigma factor [Oscillospiraceae bacterium]|nr:sigma-70 family RNA polymerase sigma factor [Oscillospiraceae bacterium]MDE6132229.1 sigma-70 family RNA polymerase sigma factor [Oscillospiraceae bacterium]
MYSDMVYRLAYARSQNVHDAQDITQDVFLKYIRSEKKFNDEEHRKAWLIRVTVNAGNSLAKSAWNRHRADISEAEAETVELPEKSGVYYAVRELPEKYRVTVHLFYYEEFSVKEIGRILGIGETAVKSRLFRAREMLREMLGGENFEF